MNVSLIVVRFAATFDTALTKASESRVAQRVSSLKKPYLSVLSFSLNSVARYRGNAAIYLSVYATHPGRAFET